MNTLITLMVIRGWFQFKTLSRLLH